MDNNNFHNIVYAAIIAFSGALCKEINDKSRTKESFSIFFGEVLLHGFSGWIVGLIGIKFFGFNDYTSISICAGIGGLFGFQLVKLLAKKFFSKELNMNVNLDEENKENK